MTKPAEIERRLARAYAHLATLAPGGSRWPGYTIPKKHKTYALVKFEGKLVKAGGATIEMARAHLARKILKRASR